MKVILSLVFAFSLPVALFAQDIDKKKAEFGALEGTWKAVGMEAGGSPFPGANVPDFRFIVAADGEAISKSPFGEYQATLTVDPEKTPKTIDNLHVTGGQKGKIQYGIYKLEQDKWTVCMSPPGVSEQNRPKSFDTKGTVNAVIIFKRLQEEKTP